MTRAPQDRCPRSPRVGIQIPYDASPQRFAPTAEALGYDWVGHGEHVLFRQPLLNGFVALSAAAAVTTRIRLLSSLTLVPLYPAALVAKLVASLDVLSAGRFELGVGVGGEVPEEFAACGVDVRARGALTDAALERMRELFDASADRAAPAGAPRLLPGPLQRPGPPLWVGGRSERAMRRAARVADHWLPYLVTPQQLADGSARLTAMAAEHGRDRPPRAAVSCFVAVAPKDDVGHRRARDFVADLYGLDPRRIERYVVGGSSATVAARLREYVDAGAESILVSLCADAASGPGMARLLAEEVRPLL